MRYGKSPVLWWASMPKTNEKPIKQTPIGISCLCNLSVLASARACQTHKQNHKHNFSEISIFVIARSHATRNATLPCLINSNRASPVQTGGIRAMLLLEFGDRNQVWKIEVLICQHWHIRNKCEKSLFANIINI